MSRFSIATGEEFNDNILFDEDKIHDFITFFNPTLSLFYIPLSEAPPVFTANLGSSAQIFARESEYTNFGKNIFFNTGYSHYYSPRLTFHLSDSLTRVGETRVGSFSGQPYGGTLGLPTQLPTSGIIVSPGVSQGANDLVSRGDILSNSFSAQAKHLYSPNTSFIARYALVYSNFLDEGGSEITHAAGIRGVYKWGGEHNLHAGYTVQVIDGRDRGGDVVHNFDVGDDYFSIFKVQFDPTLTLSASTGIGLNTGSEGPRVVNNLNLTLIKLWQRARLAAGVRRGLTSSLGVAGPSQTTSLFSNFSGCVTRRLTGYAGMSYSYFDTDEVNFSTAQAQAGLQYMISNWLSSNLGYSYRFRDGGAGAGGTILRTGSKVTGNSVFLAFTGTFDLWPNAGMAKHLPRQSECGQQAARAFPGEVLTPSRGTDSGPAPVPNNDGTLRKTPPADSSGTPTSSFGVSSMKRESFPDQGKADDPRESVSLPLNRVGDAHQVAESRRPTELWTVQVGAFTREGDAETLAKKLSDRGHHAYVLAADVNGRTWYRVRVGYWSGLDQAKAAQQTMRDRERLSTAFVVVH